MPETPLPTRPLEVLVLESHPYASDRAARRLEAAGHHVHRCHDDDGPGFPCTGLAGRGCPLDDPLDVALVVRRPHEGQPTRREDGVQCAVRAGIPLVEEGAPLFDPFGPWVDVRVRPGGDAVAACEAAASGPDRRLAAAVAVRLAPSLRAAGLDPDGVRCRLERRGVALDVHLDLPPGPMTTGLREALAVRVLDAVRDAGGKTRGSVDVHVHPSLGEVTSS